MATKNVVVCDQCGKEAMRRVADEDWIWLGLWKRDVLDLCSLQCVIDIAARLKEK
jgi:hypothetical protein